MNPPLFTTKSDRQSFRKVFSMLGKFRDLENDMPIAQAVILSWVALNEGKTQKQLRDDLDMASSTASRNLAALSKVHRLGKPGHGMIEWHDSAEDRRVKLLYLTPKGRKFVSEVLETITP